MLEDLPAGDLPLSPASLAATVAEARAFVAEVVPFGALAAALSGSGNTPGPGDTAAELENLSGRAQAGTLRRTPGTPVTARLVLETLTWFARHRFSDPAGAPIPAGLARDTAVDALLHALVPAGDAR